MQICNKKNKFASETNSFHILYVESKNMFGAMFSVCQETLKKSQNFGYSILLTHLDALSYTQNFEIQVD
jgi:hypothetical protein